MEDAVVEEVTAEQTLQHAAEKRGDASSGEVEHVTRVQSLDNSLAEIDSNLHSEGGELDLTLESSH